jgi:hypothetical protein
MERRRTFLFSRIIRLINLFPPKLFFNQTKEKTTEQKMDDPILKWIWMMHYLKGHGACTLKLFTAVIVAIS